MVVWTAFWVLVSAATPPVEISTLKGEQHVGQLDRLTADEVVLRTPTGVENLAAADLLAIRFPGATASVPKESPLEVRLVDSSLLRVASYQATATEALITHSQLGELKIPLNLVQSVRFAAADSKVDGEWKQLLSKASRKDQIAIRKNDVLDHLDGVIGALDAGTIKFRLDGDDIPVKRERVFGLIYARREGQPGRTTANLNLSAGDHLFAKSIGWDGDVWKVKLAAGPDLTIPGSEVQFIDYTLGKIAYLSNLEPRDVKYTPYFPDFIWEYRRDRSPPRSGPPAAIGFGSKTYAKGLAVHSLTALKYRIGGDYRRFQALMGIDEYFYCGNVDVTVKGDGRVLFKGPVHAGQPPQPLDLDVTGVVELEIIVDYGEDKVDVGDWVNLADAKLVK